MKAINRTFFAILFLGIVLLTIQLENITLRSVDAPVYSSIAKELLDKPLASWVKLTWRSGEEFYENPQLVPWILAISFKTFGVSAFSASLPIIIISIFTIIALYYLGRELVNKRFGYLSMLALILTPQFLKHGRNPMLEPAIMLFTTASIYFGITSINRNRIWLAVLGGVFTALAFLSKGPMALISLGVIPSFFIISVLFLKDTDRHKCNLKVFFKHFSLLIISFALTLGLMDLWHFLIFKQSFIQIYLERRVLKTLAFKGDINYIGRDHLFYFKVLVKKYWPFLPLVIISPIVMLKKTNKEVFPGLIMGLLITFGYLIPFSFVTFKASWYINLMYTSLSLLSASVLYQLNSSNIFENNIKKIVTTLAVLLLFLSSTFPSIFIRERPFHKFLMGAQKEVGNNISYGSFCSTILTDPWPFEFLNRFYLNLYPVPCLSDYKYQYKIIDVTKTKILKDESVLFTRHPYALLKLVTIQSFIPIN